MSVTSIKEFLKLESAGGILLAIATIFALVAANSPLAGYYNLLLDTPFGVHVGDFAIDKPILLWINDGLMAVFFFLVGLELKREILDGELSTPSQLVLPLLGAAGGILLPALIYSWINAGDPVAMAGWAIPAATDIAFALGIMALLGNRVPAELKLILLAIAIIDDLGAIVIIALFYTQQISLLALGAAAVGIVGLFILNRMNVARLAPYILIGIFIWVCVLKSGVHATLAGVVVAMMIPFRVKGREESITEEVEHNLHPWVAFGILPIFAFANAGLSLSGLGFETVTHPISLGIILGLFLGKQLGIFTMLWLAVKLGFGKLPGNLSWPQVYGMAILCGIGFTMSLFIGSLAFEETGVDNFVYDRVGILAASVLSAIVGYGVLALTGRRSGAA